ncbi:MAG: preprotein translocase YidC subunit [Flaviaesturariibacter sp.]|nr:preprotein translocase YidC subunit [Flaviaesturariibacter sp.]
MPIGWRISFYNIVLPMLAFYKEIQQSKKIINKKFDVLFYAENAYYFQYFRHLFTVLTDAGNLAIGYITSDKTDPVLNLQKSGLETFYLEKTLLFAFPKLQSKVMILTMPDLQNYAFKRSAGVQNYLYVFHALVSIHQQYAAKAFDHFDAFLCCGAYHQDELRELEALHGLPAKTKIEYGYPLIDELKSKVALAGAPNQKRLLIAPSWYEAGILSTCLMPLLENLQPTNREITIRPHPEFLKRNKKEVAQLQYYIRQHPNLSLDLSPDVYDCLSHTAILITDRSGIALEYAFATGRPVLFINTAPKIKNPEWEQFISVPVENRTRRLIGIEVEKDQLQDIPNAIKRLIEDQEKFKKQIASLQQELIYDNHSWQKAYDYVQFLAGL